MDNQYLEILNDVLLYSKKEDYLGYNKHDALNSEIIRKLSFNNPLIRFFWTQFILRFPCNLRRFFKVKKVRNPKGIALFVLSYINLAIRENDKRYDKEIISLLDWLERKKIINKEGYGWSTNYDWQSIHFYEDSNTPNNVTTSFVVKAFLFSYKYFGNKRYLDIALKGLNYSICGDNRLIDNDEYLFLKYSPNGSVKIINVNALIAENCLYTYKVTNDENYLVQGEKILKCVLTYRNEKYKLWSYAYPPKVSFYKGFDNYHTGFILDCLLGYYLETKDTLYCHAYKESLEAYRKELFYKDIVPKYWHNKKYPIDIHGCSQGIITFQKASVINKNYSKIAKNILDYTIEHFFDKKKKYFYYQKHRFFRKKYLLMRWNNAWMAYAISMFIKN